MFGEFKTGFGGIVFHYEPHQLGSRDNPFGPLNITGIHADSYQLEALIFDLDSWDKLKTLHSALGLETSDLLITCNNLKTQEKAYHPLRESLWLTQVPEEKRNKILATAVKLYNKPCLSG